MITPEGKKTNLYVDRRPYNTQISGRTLESENSSARCMVAQEVIIRNKLGLHARPAAHFVRIASQFKSDVFLIKDDVRINAKSIMGVMMLAAEQGASLTIECQGEDEVALLAKLTKLVEDKFYEE